MTQTIAQHRLAAGCTLALLVVLNLMPGWFAGTRLAWFTEQVDVRLRDADAQREDLDALLAGYYEALVRKTTNFTKNRGFLQYSYRPNIVSATRPGQRVTNSLGMVDQEYTQTKPVGTRRMVLIGDSISVGKFGENFETLLEDRINRDHRTANIRKFEILNLAVDGYRITQLLGVGWQRAPAFEPDVYVVALTRLSVARRWSFHVGQLLQSDVDLRYDFLRKVAVDAGLRKTDSLSRIDRKLARFHGPVVRWSVGQIAAAAERHKAKLVVLLMPWTIADPTVDAHFQLARQELAALRVPVIDLRDSFAGETDMRQLRVSREDYHPNPRGHRIMEERLYRSILADPQLSEVILGHVPGGPGRPR